MTLPLRQRDLAFVAAAVRDGTLDASDAAWLSGALSEIADGEPADLALGLRRQRAAMLAAIKAAIAFCGMRLRSCWRVCRRSRQQRDFIGSWYCISKPRG